MVKLPIHLSFWCLEPELNQRHTDFQSVALPTELSRPKQQFNKCAPDFKHKKTSAKTIVTGSCSNYGI